MKLVHAVWEMRNMGVDCWEVAVGHGDTIGDLDKARETFETEYTVVKVPAGMMEICRYLQSEGYTYMETMIECHHEMKIPEMNSVQKRMVEHLTYAEMDERDRKKLFSEIEAGLFKDDRISLDPYFSQKQASDRYIGWINDETGKGSQIYKAVYKGNDVGFFTYKDLGNGVYFPYIGGLYTEYLQSGLGIALNCCEIKEAIRRQGRRILSSYSTNNRGAAAIHMHMGYTLDEITYVFVKHCVP